MKTMSKHQKTKRIVAIPFKILNGCKDGKIAQILSFSSAAKSAVGSVVELTDKIASGQVEKNYGKRS